MSESSNIFIRWSGVRSGRAAKALPKLLPDFVPAAKTPALIGEIPLQDVAAAFHKMNWKLLETDEVA